MEGFAEIFMEKGIEQDRKKMNDLISWLIGQERWEDLKRSTYDADFQDALFEEMYRNRKKEDVLV